MLFGQIQCSILNTQVIPKTFTGSEKASIHNLFYLYIIFVQIDKTIKKMTGFSNLHDRENEASFYLLFQMLKFCHGMKHENTVLVNN